MRSLVTLPKESYKELLTGYIKSFILDKEFKKDKIEDEIKITLKEICEEEKIEYNENMTIEKFVDECDKLGKRII